MNSASYIEKPKHKAKLLMAVICGPVFAAALLVFMLLASLIPASVSDYAPYFVWPAAAAGCGTLGVWADRLGRRFNLSPQEYAAPVAFSCVICALGSFFLFWTVVDLFRS